MHEGYMIEVNFFKIVVQINTPYFIYKGVGDVPNNFSYDNAQMQKTKSKLALFYRNLETKMLFYALLCQIRSSGALICR